MFFTLCRSPSPKGSISWGVLGVNGYGWGSSQPKCGPDWESLAVLKGLSGTLGSPRRGEELRF